MKDSNIEFLDLNRASFYEVMNAGTAKKANAIKADLLRILREEFIPGYVYSEDCGTCVFDLVTLVYRRYDEWLAANPDPVPEPIPMKANFPSHKNKGK